MADLKLYFLKLSLNSELFESVSGAAISLPLVNLCMNFDPQMYYTMIKGFSIQVHVVIGHHQGYIFFRKRLFLPYLLYHIVRFLPDFVHTFLLFPPKFLPQFQFWLNCFPTQNAGNLQEYIPLDIIPRKFDLWLTHI